MLTHNNVQNPVFVYDVECQTQYVFMGREATFVFVLVFFILIWLLHTVKNELSHTFFVTFLSAPKPMQDGWGGGGEDMSLSGGQWDTEEGDMWNSTASQESSSSCNSWGNASKKGPQKVLYGGLCYSLILHFHNNK